MKKGNLLTENVFKIKITTFPCYSSVACYLNELLFGQGKLNAMVVKVPKLVQNTLNIVFCTINRLVLSP